MLRLGTSTEDDHQTPPPPPSPQTETTTNVSADPSSQASPADSHPVSGDRAVLDHQVGAKGALRQSISGPSAEEDHRRRGRCERAARDDQGRHGAGWAAGESGGEEECGRERLKRHRVAMAGRVWIPDTWGQESLLKDWVDCAAVDRALVPGGLVSAREALVEECRRAEPGSGFRIESTCLST